VPLQAVFLDRDGVINRAVLRDGRPYPPAAPSDLEILPGVEDALRRLQSVGYLLIVVTNQPDVARGTTLRTTVEEMNRILQAKLPLKEFRVCYHDSGEGCACRKPRPGMLIDAARTRDIDLRASFMVGDRWRDIEAGRAAGCRTIYIDYHYDERRPEAPDHVVASLAQATDIILTNYPHPHLDKAR
jgi:D-glycero-D-manno-heptose 1,7-bisphosphate phosphatase